MSKRFAYLVSLTVLVLLWVAVFEMFAVAMALPGCQIGPTCEDGLYNRATGVVVMHAAAAVFPWVAMGFAGWSERR